MSYKIDDWVEILDGEQKGHIGKITYIFKTTNELCILFNNNQIVVLYNNVKKCPYIHKSFSCGWFKFSIFRLKKKLSIRIEISKGWE